MKKTEKYFKHIDKYGNYGYQGIHRVRVAKTTTVYEIYDVSGSAHDYEEAHQLALDKAQGSETDVKLVGTKHIHETKVKGSFLYNRLSTEGDRLQKDIFPSNWTS